jgi:hypothetical protein
VVVGVLDDCVVDGVLDAGVEGGGVVDVFGEAGVELLDPVPGEGFGRLGCGLAGR